MNPDGSLQYVNRLCDTAEAMANNQLATVYTEIEHTPKNLMIPPSSHALLPAFLRKSV